MEMVSSVTDQCVISPSLLVNIDPHPDLWIGWEELLGEPVDLGSEQYARLFQQRVHPADGRVSDELDELLMAASQQYKQSSQQYETHCTEGQLDELFLEASQLLDIEPLNNSMVVKPSGKQQVNVEPLDKPVVVKPSGKHRFGQPQSEKDIQTVKKSRVPKTTLQNSEWEGIKPGTERKETGSNCCTIRTWTPYMLWKIGVSMYGELILHPVPAMKTGQAPSRQHRVTPSI